MYIEFETTQLIDGSFPNNKVDGAFWYTRSQPALLFKEGQKYPDKFDLNLSFSGSQQEQQSVSGFAVGRYELSEEAYGFDNRRNPTVDFTKLKPLTPSKSKLFEQSKT